MTGGRAVVDREQLAREVLADFTRTGDIGELIDEVPEGAGLVTLRFAATMAGYPGWHWSVSLAQLEDEEPTVLESELLPGDGALLAPDWVPWSERLEEWRAQQAAEAGPTADAAADADPGEDPDEDGPDEDDSDEDDEDDESDQLDEPDDDESDYEDDDEADEFDEADDDDDDDDDDFGDDVYDGLDPEAAAGFDDEDDDLSDGPAEENRS